MFSGRTWRNNQLKSKLKTSKHRRASLPHREEIGRTREKLSEATGVPQKKLETIIDQENFGDLNHPGLPLSLELENMSYNFRTDIEVPFACD